MRARSGFCCGPSLLLFSRPVSSLTPGDAAQSGAGAKAAGRAAAPSLPALRSGVSPGSAPVVVLLSEPSSDAPAACPGSLSRHLALLMSHESPLQSLKLITSCPASCGNAALTADSAAAQIPQESQYYLSPARLLGQ